MTVNIPFYLQPETGQTMDNRCYEGESWVDESDNIHVFLAFAIILIIRANSSHIYDI